MKWFKHDTDASNDAKVKKLILRHGAEGYAVYFHCIELIAGSIRDETINFELEHDSEIIADNLKIRGDKDFSAIDKVNNIMRAIVELNLFQESNNKIYCLKLATRIDQSMTSNPKMRKMIQEIRKSHDPVMINHDTVMQDKIRLDKTIIDKSKKSKRKTSIFKPPTSKEIDEFIIEFCNENDLQKVSSNDIFDFYESKDWMVGKNKMKDWKAAVRKWVRGNQKPEQKSIYKNLTGM